MLTTDALSIDVNYVTNVPGRAPLTGQVFIFCNGIGTNLESAKEGAKFISNSLGGRKVCILHNEASLSEDVFSPDSPRNLATIKKLQETITDEIENANAQGSTNIRIRIFAHSHGAYITKKALECLSQHHKSYTEAYCFGGASVISNALASVVHNYIRESDMTALCGNGFLDTDPGTMPIYQLRLSLHQEEQKYGNLLMATISYVWESYRNHLISQMVQNNSDAQRDYRQLTQEGTIPTECLRYMINEASQVFNCLTNYTIDILPDREYDPPTPAYTGDEPGLQWVGPWLEDKFNPIIAALAHHCLNEHGFVKSYGAKVKAVCGTIP